MMIMSVVYYVAVNGPNGYFVVAFQATMRRETTSVLVYDAYEGEGSDESRTTNEEDGRVRR